MKHSVQSRLKQLEQLDEERRLAAFNAAWDDVVAEMGAVRHRLYMSACTDDAGVLHAGPCWMSVPEAWDAFNEAHAHRFAPWLVGEAGGEGEVLFDWWGELVEHQLGPNVPLPRMEVLPPPPPEPGGLWDHAIHLATEKGWEQGGHLEEFCHHILHVLAWARVVRRRQAVLSN